MPTNDCRPILRWAGSKRKIVPRLKEYWMSENHERYIEPFVGSAQLFYAIRPRKAILADLNGELIEMYRTVSKRPIDVYSAMTKMKISSSNYYRLREEDPSKLEEVEKAARFLYLNRFCFNGIYRTNSQGKFNVPFSNSNVAKGFVEFDNFMLSARQIEKARLVCSDFEKVVRKNVRERDFVYLDPPYAVENRRIFKQYGPQTFGLNDLHRLKLLLDEIHAKGASFLLSYAYCRESIEIAASWNSEKLFTQRNVAGFSVHRRKAAELLITNIN